MLALFIVIHILMVVLNLIMFRTAGRLQLFDGPGSIVFFMITMSIPFINIILFIYVGIYMIIEFLSTKNNLEINEFAANILRRKKISLKKKKR